MIAHTNLTVTDKTLRSMLARELLSIRHQRKTLSTEVIYWMTVTSKTCYSHINQEYVAMEVELWQALTKHQTSR